MKTIIRALAFLAPLTGSFSSPLPKSSVNGLEPRDLTAGPPICTVRDNNPPLVASLFIEHAVAELNADAKGTIQVVGDVLLLCQGTTAIDIFNLDTNTPKNVIKGDIAGYLDSMVKSCDHSKGAFVGATVERQDYSVRISGVKDGSCPQIEENTSSIYSVYQW